MSSALAQGSSPMWRLASCQEALGAELACPRPAECQCSMPKKARVSTGYLKEVVRKGRAIHGKPSALLTVPAPSSSPQARDSCSVGPSAHHSQSGGTAALAGAALGQRVELLLSTRPALGEHARGPARACTTCVCARTSPGRSAQGQSVRPLPNAEVTRSHSRCWRHHRGLCGCPAKLPSEDGKRPKGESLPRETLPSSRQLAHLQACRVL